MQHEKDCAAIFFREANLYSSQVLLLPESLFHAKGIYNHTIREIQAGLPTWTYREYNAKLCAFPSRKIQGQWLRKNPHTEHIAFTVTGSFDNYSRFPIKPPINSGT